MSVSKVNKNRLTTNLTVQINNPEKSESIQKLATEKINARIDRKMEKNPNICDKDPNRDAE